MAAAVLGAMALKTEAAVEVIADLVGKTDSLSFFFELENKFEEESLSVSEDADFLCKRIKKRMSFDKI